MASSLKPCPSRGGPPHVFVPGNSGSALRGLPGHLASLDDGRAPHAVSLSILGTGTLVRSTPARASTAGTRRTGACTSDSAPRRRTRVAPPSARDRKLDSGPPVSTSSSPRRSGSTRWAAWPASRSPVSLSPTKLQPPFSTLPISSLGRAPPRASLAPARRPRRTDSQAGRSHQRHQVRPRPSFRRGS